MKLETKAILKKLISKLSNLKKKEGNKSIFIMTDSGLKYRDITVGKGDKPKSGDNVLVSYIGWLNNFDSSDKFDSSCDSETPFLFKVGAGEVISGWDEAILTDMPVGTVRQVIIPPKLGYGDSEIDVIPPNSTLYFNIELLYIYDKSKILCNKK